MNLNLTVKRHRMSVTQGEAEVLVNGKRVVRYGDNITMDGQFERFGGWGSTKSDEHFITAAMKQYTDKIIELSK